MSIYAELHRIRTQSEAPAQISTSTNDSRPSTSGMAQTQSRSTEPQTRQSASIGQIEEVDLGPTAAARNTTLTEAAYQPSHPHTHPDEPRIETRPRLDRNGKPRPPRRNQRRPDEDLARDALVEAVMRENHLSHYSADPADSAASTSDFGTLPNDTAADDALAARFQAEYLEAMAERRDVNKKPPAPAPAKPGEALMNGPKLGGSRSARAAMHAAEKEREAKRGKGVLGSIGLAGKR